MKIAFRLFPLLGLLLLIANACEKKEEAQTLQQHSIFYDCRLMNVVESTGSCKDSTYLIYEGDKISSAIRVNNCSGGTPGQPLLSRK